MQQIGDENKTRLEIQKFYMGTELNSARAGFRAGVRDATLIINLGEGDGFLKTVAGSELKVTFDVGLTVDTDGGFRLEGGTKARVTVPVGRSILGVVTVHHIEIGLDGGAPGADLSLEVSGGFGLYIGPFSATVDRLGMHLDAKFGSGGNLGALNLDVGFKPPNGVGLRLDAGVVVGGGYLYLDPQRGEYAGALELQIGKIGIKAIGMLTTKLPDGKPGWSLLLFLYAQIPPIPLVFGFTLVGVGGMVGVAARHQHRRARAGMKTNAFDDLLFPKDPVADAPRILNRLRTLFPITPRALTIGPMVDIAWGTPRIIFLRLGILVQLDNVFDSGDASVSFSSVVLLGQLRVEIGKDPGQGDARQADRRHPRLLGRRREAIRLPGASARFEDRRRRHHRVARRVRRVRREIAIHSRGRRIQSALHRRPRASVDGRPARRELQDLGDQGDDDGLLRDHSGHDSVRTQSGRGGKVRLGGHQGRLGVDACSSSSPISISSSTSTSTSPSSTRDTRWRA